MAFLFTCKFPTLLRPPLSIIPLQSPTPKCVHPCHHNFTSRTLYFLSSRPLRGFESLSSIVTDDSVPEGHAGLHGFPYGDNGSEVDVSDNPNFTGKSGEDDGAYIIGLEDYVKARKNLKFAGVYAIYDAGDQIRYVGYSRNVVLSLKSHVDRVGSSKCRSVRVKLFTDPLMVSKGKLEEERIKWLDEFGVPPGNSIDKDLWESGQGPPIKVMSVEERTDYEEEKLKLRKAMGENLHNEVEGEDEDSRIRRVKILRDTEGDDWSDVIDGQTKEALDNGLKLGATVSNGLENQGQSEATSPFNRDGSTAGLYSAQTYDLTLENVDLVLNDVRPYLIADGGNVEVASVEDGVVCLRLQGACGACPSSTTTMKMGIERVLKEKFGDALKDIRQVDQQQISATVAAVNSHLDMLRPAIHNYGGSVEVISVEGEICNVKYDGPGPIGMGIQAAIKDKFPDITNVVLLSS